MERQVEKFLPRPTPESAPFWEGCQEHKLLLQYCMACSTYQFYPRVICANCMSEQIEWREASGRGTVESYTIVTRAVSEAYAADVPYVIALIILAEGPRMMSNVIGCDVDSVQSGMAVEVVYEPWSADITMPKFRPVAGGGE
ncbi:Zn-ribbon domain-containing OB-fold protein [Altererythrobacter sp. GH1-8]|uniref:Zn-ribbon domain-containing OB-fold protein n=1 Tax=Altererythrobacter sp. GH1-8 TaxID=3349333 RepID=UPI00374CA362